MSSPIVPLQGPTGPPDLTSSARNVHAEMDLFESQLAAAAQALGIEAGDAGPPPKVLDEMAAAGRISRQLSESGHELRFLDGSQGRVTVELADSEGNTVRTMKIAEALQIAAGKPLG